MPTPSPIAALRRTRSSAQALASKLAAHAPVGGQPSSRTVIPHPSLVFPEPIQTLGPRLVGLGIDGSTASRVASAVWNASASLRRAFQEDFDRRGPLLRSCAPYFDGPKSASLIPSAYTAIYAKTTNDWVSYIVEEFAPRLLKVLPFHNKDSIADASRARRPFNQSAIPLLERFFDDNAFPSRLEKYELAHICDMEYRQIHVWFQNRRRRFRKEGRQLRQRGQKRILSEELENSILETFLPIRPEDEEDADVIDGTVHSAVKGFSPVVSMADAPAHAFPSPYPPLCTYNPFPLDEPARCFVTPWPRKQPSVLPPAPAVDLSDMVADFSRLSIRSAEVDSTTTTVSRPPATSPSTNCIGFNTHCSRAPHPALINRRTRRSSRHPTRPPGACERPITRIESRPRGWCLSTRRPLSIPLGPGVDTSAPVAVSTRCRLKRALPQRLPKHPPLYSTVQDTPSSTRSSSTASAASDTDSPLSTPPVLPLNLPISIVDPVDTAMLNPHLSEDFAWFLHSLVPPDISVSKEPVF